MGSILQIPITSSYSGNPAIYGAFIYCLLTVSHLCGSSPSQAELTWQWNGVKSTVKKEEEEKISPSAPYS